MSLPFDPSTHSVKKATKKLEGLSLDELDALRDAELAGKNRVTLLTAIDEVASDAVDAAQDEGEKAEEAPYAVPQPFMSQSVGFSRSRARDKRIQAKKDALASIQAHASLPSEGPGISDAPPIESFSVDSPLLSGGQDRWLRAQLLAESK